MRQLFAPTLCANSLRQLFLLDRNHCHARNSAGLHRPVCSPAHSPLSRRTLSRLACARCCHARGSAGFTAPSGLLHACCSRDNPAHCASCSRAQLTLALRPAPLHPCETAGSLTTASFNAPSALLHAFAAVETTLRYPGTLVRWQTHHRCFNRHAATSAPLSLF